jgi:predicted Zn-dependent protease with MMP-like domain
MGPPLKKREFDQRVRKALQKIPPIFREALRNIQIVVDAWPDPDLMEEITGDREEVLYGLFIGKPLPETHYDDWGDLPSTIHIYQGPLEADFPDPEELEREIEITLAHEIAHYLGFNEETLERYGYG